MATRIVLVVCAAALLSACAGSPAREDDVYKAPPEPTRTPAATPRQATDPGLRNASVSLRLEARQALMNDELDRAQALLQRAHRIDPTDAEVYLDLAELYAREGDFSASRAMAERGLLYCEPTNCARLRALLGN